MRSRRRHCSTVGLSRKCDIFEFASFSFVVVEGRFRKLLLQCCLLGLKKFKTGQNRQHRRAKESRNVRHCEKGNSAKMNECCWCASALDSVRSSSHHGVPFRHGIHGTSLRSLHHPFLSRRVQGKRERSAGKPIDVEIDELKLGPDSFA